jgi:ABC-type multidrug transport system fused ATPase/permease subunit
MKTFLKILSLLNFKQKSNLLILFILMVLGAGLEMIGIGILLPVIAIMSQGDKGLQSPFIKTIIDVAGVSDMQSILFYVLGGLVFIYVLKMLFLGFVAWEQNKFIFGLQSHLSQKLYAGYLAQPYIFHIQRNSSTLINNVTLVVQQFSASLMALLNLLTESFNLLGIVALLLFIEPSATLLVFSILGLSAWAFYSMTKKQLYSWGKDLNFHESLRIKHLQQGLGGLKELKIFGAEKEFGGKYEFHNRFTARINRNYQTIQALPRLWLEFLSVVGIVILIGFMVMQGNPINAVLPKLGIFAAAAFRLIPSLNKIISSIQNVRYTKQPLEVLSNEIKMVEVGDIIERKEKIAFSEKLELDEVSFQYPSADRESLKNVSLEIIKGDTVGFIGTTGAGKSTLVDIILGLLGPDRGKIKIDGVDIHSNIRGWQKQIGYVPQFIFLIDDSLRNNIAFGIPESDINEEAMIRAVRLAQLEVMINDFPEGLNTNVGERGVRLSGGQRQRIGIARALYHDPDVIVLDEATSSLDVATESSVMESIRALHGTKTILIIAHRYSTIQHCDMIYRLDNGEIVRKGDPIELLN